MIETQMTQGELSYTFDTHSLMWSCRPGQKYFIDEKTELNRGFFNLAEVTSWQEIEERLAPDLRTYRELTAPPELPGISQIHQTTWGPYICVQGWPPPAQHPCPPEILLTQQAPARPLPQTLGEQISSSLVSSARAQASLMESGVHGLDFHPQNLGLEEYAWDWTSDSSSWGWGPQVEPTAEDTEYWLNKRANSRNIFISQMLIHSINDYTTI